MKKLLVSIVILSMLGFNTLAYAADEGAVVDAGITPDSILYSADLLIEDLQLAFTTDTEAEANLLIEFAEERLAEAKEMTEQEKNEFVQTAVDDYMEKLGEAQEKVLDVITDESIDTEVKDELTENLEQAAEVDEAIEESLGEEQVEELEEKTEEVIYNANVVKGIDTGVVKTLRESGMGFGQIAQAALLAEMSGKTIEEVGVLFSGEGKGLGDVAKELGIHPSEIKGKRASEIEKVKVVDDGEGEETEVEIDDGDLTAASTDAEGDVEIQNEAVVVEEEVVKKQEKVEIAGDGKAAAEEKEAEQLEKANEEEEKSLEKEAQLLEKAKEEEEKRLEKEAEQLEKVREEEEKRLDKEAEQLKEERAKEDKEKVESKKGNDGKKKD